MEFLLERKLLDQIASDRAVLPPAWIESAMSARSLRMSIPISRSGRPKAGEVEAGVSARCGTSGRPPDGRWAQAEIGIVLDGRAVFKKASRSPACSRRLPRQETLRGVQVLRQDSPPRTGRSIRPIRAPDPASRNTAIAPLWAVRNPTSPCTRTSSGRSLPVPERQGHVETRDLGNEVSLDRQPAGRKGRRSTRSAACRSSDRR